jgi:hypothetical protein
MNKTACATTEFLPSFLPVVLHILSIIQIRRCAASADHFSWILQGRVMYDVLVYLPASQVDSKDEPPTELILELDGSAVAPISAHIKKCVLHRSYCFVFFAERDNRQIADVFMEGEVLGWKAGFQH